MYTADGEFLFKFGSHGEGNGQFNAPTGVAVDTNGNIIVADWGNSRIQVSFRKPHLTESRENILQCIDHLTNLSVLYYQPGVRQLRLLPVLHQHISRPPLWPSGLGPHIRWSCGCCRLWKPLLQGLPLLAVETWGSHLHCCKN